MPKLTPLQSRFAASFAASLVLLAIYLLAFSSQFAYALDLISTEDHNHILLDDPSITISDDLEEAILYRPDFLGLERGIIGRAPDAPSLENNEPQRLNITAGQKKTFTVRKSTIFGPCGASVSGLPFASEDSTSTVKYAASTTRCKDEELSSRLLHITVNTCRQPIGTGPRKGVVAPPLQVYVSTDPDNKTPGPNQPSSQTVEVEDGFGSTAVTPSGDAFISVMAPDSDGFEGGYNYELAVSIDSPFHNYLDTDYNLFFIDSDATSALFITDNLTLANERDPVYQQWMNLKTPPFTMFAVESNKSSVAGLSHSYCGLLNQADVSPADEDDVQVDIINRGLGKLPKQQFHLKSLKRKTEYTGLLAMSGNSTKSGAGVIGGGGSVWKPIQFETKADDNCGLLFDLDFCSEVAYAVPTNPKTFPTTEKLTNFYDTQVRSLYKNFTLALAQVACDTPATERYSLATNCSTCAAAYKSWLCAVTIPRCVDFSSPASDVFLAARNIAQPFLNGSSLSQAQVDALGGRTAAFANSSRNPRIDSEIRPGPYKEVKPCLDLCYGLVQNCPASLGFGCPDGKWADRSYGQRSGDGSITCSYLGAAFFLNGANRMYGGGGGGVASTVVFSLSASALVAVFVAFVL
ncbi:MAG: hypothetical protein M1825_004445 [Sarcosagium campestre]|nr:MAG: hypothetical protein M1825_004445 [Sarcosagium campestre]